MHSVDPHAEDDSDEARAFERGIICQHPTKITFLNTWCRSSEIYVGALRLHRRPGRAYTTKQMAHAATQQRDHLQSAPHQCSGHGSKPAGSAFDTGNRWANNKQASREQCEIKHQDSAIDLTLYMSGSIDTFSDHVRERKGTSLNLLK